jgi:hypothetical protein
LLMFVYHSSIQSGALRGQPACLPAGWFSFAANERHYKILPAKKTSTWAKWDYRNWPPPLALRMMR